MTQLGLHELDVPDRRTVRERRDPPRSFRVNWNAIGVATAIAVALLSWLGNGAKEVRDVSGRLTTLETQRTEDVRRQQDQRAEDLKWRERVDDKLDALIGRPKR